MTVLAIVWRVGLGYDPFPLTPALSLREREKRIPFRDESERSDYTPARGMGLPLLGERVGVRGNGTTVRRASFARDLTCGLEA